MAKLDLNIKKIKIFIIIQNAMTSVISLQKIYQRGLKIEIDLI